LILRELIDSTISSARISLHAAASIRPQDETLPEKFSALTNIDAHVT
jgi:hypothetical protein